ncbi:MAG: DNA-binding protein [Frankiales bacterium]|nr:DNA-binding protein [Frankiales bacterium]
MAHLQVLATHQPCWGSDARRVVGYDEDALTLAVAAGRAVVEHAPDAVTSVVLVTRDLPGLEGGTEAILLAGLGLPSSTRCSVVLGGAPAALDAISTGAPGTLVITADVEPAAGAGAALLGTSGAELGAVGRSEGSLPLKVRNTSGGTFDYDDPRLQRVRGTNAALDRLALDDKPIAVAGLGAKDAASLVQGSPAALPTTGASSVVFALADALERSAAGLVTAVEQATACVARLASGSTAVLRSARAARPFPKTQLGADASIAISLPAYERAFDSKLGLQAGQCATCGTLALPPRHRCIECGSEDPHPLTPLPRDGVVYTAVSVHVPVPGLRTPYDLAIVELGDTGVRLLTPVTGGEPATTAIGDAGTLVLRRLAVRHGIPDYGYAFEPTEGATP